MKKITSKFFLVLLASLGLTLSACNLTPVNTGGNGGDSGEGGGDGGGQGGGGGEGGGGATTNEEKILAHMATINNFTSLTTYDVTDDSGRQQYSARVTNKFTGHEVEQATEYLYGGEMTYAQAMAYTNTTTVEAMKEAVLAVSDVNGMKYEYTFDDSSEKVTYNVVRDVYRQYVAYEQAASQFYSVIFQDGQYRYFTYLLDSDAALFGESYFLLNAQVFKDIIKAENFKDGAYQLAETKTLYLNMGDGDQLSGKNFLFKFDANNNPVEFAFDAIYGAQTRRFVVTYPDIGHTTVTVPQFEKEECDHRYCEHAYEDLGKDGHHEYCYHCQKYLDEKKPHNFETRTHVCTDCLAIDYTEEYKNANYQTPSGVDYARFVKTSDNQLYVYGEFTGMSDVEGRTWYYEGDAYHTVQFVYELATKKLAVIEYQQNELIPNQTCIRRQMNELRLYVLDIDAHVAEYEEKFGAENVYNGEWIYDQTTDTNTYVIDRQSINYYSIIRLLIVGDEELKGFGYFETNAQKVCTDSFYSAYESHRDVYHNEQVDPCHTVSYHLCENCHEYVGSPYTYTEHHWNWASSTPIAAPDGFSGQLFFEVQCEHCNETRKYYINQNDARNHTDYKGITVCFYYEGSMIGDTERVQLPHIYDETHHCVLCGAKEITSISIPNEFVEEEYEAGYSRIEIPYININYYDGTSDIIYYADEENYTYNYTIYLSYNGNTEQQYEYSPVDTDGYYGPAKIIVDYLGLKAEANTSIVGKRESVSYAQLELKEHYVEKNQVVEGHVKYYGEATDFNWSFFNKMGEETTAGTVVSQSEPVKVDNYYEFDVSFKFAQNGDYNIELDVIGYHDSSAETHSYVMVYDEVNFVASENLVFKYLQDGFEGDVILGEVRYKNAEDYDYARATIDLYNYVSYSELNELDAGEHKRTINVYGTELEVTIVVVKAVDFEILGSYDYLTDSYELKTEYAFEDGGIRMPFGVEVEYSDGSKAIKDAQNIEVYKEEWLVPDENPDGGSKPSWGPYWNESGDFTVKVTIYGLSKTYQIHVADRLPVDIQSVEIYGAEYELVGGFGTLYFDKTPYNGDVVDVEWINNTPSIISGEQDGNDFEYEVLALGEASVTVRVTTNNGVVLEDTYTFMVKDTLWPTEDIEEFLYDEYGEEYDVPEIPNVNILYDNYGSGDAYYIRASFDEDPLETLRNLGWGVSKYQEDGEVKFYAYNEEVDLVVVVLYSPNDEWSSTYEVKILPYSVFIRRINNQRLLDNIGYALEQAFPGYVDHYDYWENSIGGYSVYFDGEESAEERIAALVDVMMAHTESTGHESADLGDVLYEVYYIVEDGQTYTILFEAYKYDSCAQVIVFDYEYTLPSKPDDGEEFDPSEWMHEAVASIYGEENTIEYPYEWPGCWGVLVSEDFEEDQVYDCAMILVKSVGGALPEGYTAEDCTYLVLIDGEEYYLYYFFENYQHAIFFVIYEA